MFDDPRKDLKRLEKQLQKEEQSDSEEWLDEEDWLDDELEEARALMDRDYSRGYQHEAVVYDYEDEEEQTVYADTPSRSKAKKEKKPKKEKGIGGLVFLACLETLGIIAVLLWWALWLL